jgi:hypothetical protein
MEEVAMEGVEGAIRHAGEAMLQVPVNTREYRNRCLGGREGHGANPRPREVVEIAASFEPCN